MRLQSIGTAGGSGTVAAAPLRTRAAHAGQPIVAVVCTTASPLLAEVVDRLLACNVSFEVVASVDRIARVKTDGVLLVGCRDATADLPAVVLDQAPQAGAASVGIDPRNEGDLAGRYLAGKGHRRVAMVCRTRDHWAVASRVEGFIATMCQHGAKPLVVYTDHQPLYGVLVRLMSDPRPTALFVADEDLSIEAAYILRGMLRLQIPQELSLVGMESPRVSQFQLPPITTISQPKSEQATKAVDLLLRHIAEGGTQPVQIMLPSWLIERESVAAG
jgi:DNA-binding LacI/PurR family transcriptional regulator